MRPIRWVANQLNLHPWRLLTTIIVLLSVSWSLAIWSVYHSFNVAHESRVENCLAIDELNRELRIAFADLHYPFVAARFEATMSCEDLP